MSIDGEEVRSVGLISCWSDGQLGWWKNRVAKFEGDGCVGEI